MVGELFSIGVYFLVDVLGLDSSFRPHGWGAFFNANKPIELGTVDGGFRPHGWGAFFNCRL